MRNDGGQGTIRSTWRTSALIWYDVVGNGLELLLLGIFFAHQDAPRFIVPSLILYLAFIASFASGIARLVMFARLDYTGEVLAIQRQLESLYALR